jgi:hypothetical protein
VTTSSFEGEPPPFDMFSPAPGVVAITHAPEVCDGSFCCVHNPSDHHMRDWPLTFRTDNGMLCPSHSGHGLVLSERICEHGCGHPDPDSLAWLRQHDPFDIGSWGIHGCCRCCQVA